MPGGDRRLGDVAIIYRHSMESTGQAWADGAIAEREVLVLARATDPAIWPTPGSCGLCLFLTPAGARAVGIERPST